MARVIGYGGADHILTSSEVHAILAESFSDQPVDGERVLVLIPDTTRTAPMDLFFREIEAVLGPRTARLDFMVALGTHPPLTPEAMDRLVGMSAPERALCYPKTALYNHDWKDPANLKTIGQISSIEMNRLTGGLVSLETPIQINRRVEEYDRIVICGPVYPHEVAGFSGGAKYLFPGIAGEEIIDHTHWLGALVTNMATIGIKDTAVRRVIHAAARFMPQPVFCLAFVMQGTQLHGLFAGKVEEAWSAAADLSEKLNILWVEHPYQTVLSMPSPIYDDLWTAGKAVYKTEPVTADGGEIILFAPHLGELSYVHGRMLRKIGYHVMDYFLKQWEQFGTFPLALLAHSTHVRGVGTFEAGMEQARIQVTLATAIPEEVCRLVNLNYRDPASIHLEDYAGRENVLVVPHAGEQVYRLKKK